MVFLRHQVPSRKRPSSSFVSPFPPPKIPKPTGGAGCGEPPARDDAQGLIEKMVSILADAGCTLINPSGPPCLPSDPHRFRAHLDRLFSSSDDPSPDLRSDFLAGLTSYIHSPSNLRRVLASSHWDGSGPRRESLVRHLLLVPAIQLDLQTILLEKLPEYFDLNLLERSGGTSLALEDDVARLIVNQFRWLDFMVDPNAFTDKLMQVLSICPSHLKKEIIGSLPEIIGDQNNKGVIVSLQQMLQEDSDIIVPVLDSFSNLNLDDELQEQVVTIAISCIRTIEGEHMPYLLRFLLLSATPSNVRRIITRIREQLNFVGISSSLASQCGKLKGKSHLGSTDASILDTLRSSLLFKNMLCQEILKLLNSLDTSCDHKVIDIWLLVLIYMNGESMRKGVEKVFKRKIVTDCIREFMIDQCICGNKELVEDYFPWFLSLSEYLMACKEQKAREFGAHMCVCLFGEFGNAYCRQEVLSTLVTHVGSGVSFEVTSALDTMALLASKYAPEMIPLSPFINGILDYLEGFDSENLHKVYEVFSRLALSARPTADCVGSSIGNEFFMIIQKQVSHPELRYKKMGIIGTLKIVSLLGDVNDATSTSSQKSYTEESLELLRTSLDSCKKLCLPLILFYDELSALLEHKKLQPAVIEWIGKHIGEFESMFLSDLEGGQLPVKQLFFGLEGELWMNLDGKISPICLNIFPMASLSMQSTTSLQILPANFHLLSTVEMLANQGSLGGIDALLGCPLHLPSSKYLSAASWQSLTTKQKQIVCFCLYYAANWIRELLNSFCTQITGRSSCTSQATKEDIIAKLLNRLRNLMFLESLLNNFIRCNPLSLPELHLNAENSGNLLSNSANNMVAVGNKNEHMTSDYTSKGNRKNERIPKASTSSDMQAKFRQPTIADVLRKAGAATSQEVSNEDTSGQSSKNKTLNSAVRDSCNSTELVTLEISETFKAFEAQRFKFRPLLAPCFSLLSFSNNQDTCCSDPAAELFLHLYLLRELHYRLDCFATPGKQFLPRCLSSPAGFTRKTVDIFVSKIRPLFPSLRRHFDTAVSILKQGDEACEEHWKVHSALAGNPDIANLVFSNSSVSSLVFKEVLNSFSKMLNLPSVLKDKSTVLDLLEAFQPNKAFEDVFSGVVPSPSPGSIEYFYLGASSFVGDVLDIACSFSFVLAFECLLALESLVTSAQSFLDVMETNGNCIHRVLLTLRIRLGTSAQKLLRHNWDGEDFENHWKNKGEMVQKIVHIFFEKSESKSDLLDEFACSILPQVSSSRTVAEDYHHGFPTLCNATFVAWYKELHEVNITILDNLVREVLFVKPKDGLQPKIIEEHLLKIQKSVTVVVSLVNICRTRDKVAVHALAVKYGGKFVDSFLKVFDFLQDHFQTHSELIIKLVMELQKATRTIQTLCSEAKGLKQMAITSKIPATKRSMERFLFRVKALLHTSSSGHSFWMGNLKHKDLTGQVVSSQVYVNDQSEDIEDLAEGSPEQA